MIPYFYVLFIQRHGMISALMIYGRRSHLGRGLRYVHVYCTGQINSTAVKTQNTKQHLDHIEGS